MRNCSLTSSAYQYNTNIICRCCIYSLCPLPPSDQKTNRFCWLKIIPTRLGSQAPSKVLVQYMKCISYIYLKYILPLLTIIRDRKDNKKQRAKLSEEHTHKVFPGRYQEWFKSEKVSNIRTKDSNDVCSTIPLLTWLEYGERSERWHYIFMMIIYLFCQVNPIRMPASYPDSKQG